MQKVAVGGLESLRVGDRARVVAAMDAYGAPTSGLLVNNGAGTTYVGADAKVNGVWSKGSVDLRNRAQILGNLVTASTVHSEPGSTVSGTSQQSASLNPFRTSTWIPQLPTGSGGDVRLEPNQARALAPGKFGEVSAKSGAVITLSPGTYYFSRLSLEPSSALKLSSTQAPTIIYLDGDFTFRGVVKDAANPANQRIPLLIATVGQNQVNVESPFLGTVFAPNAPVAVIGGVHYGAFFGKQVELRPDAVVVHSPFDWKAVLPPTVVNLGSGNDTFSIFDLCELVPGDTIDGGGGDDTLVTPVPVEQLTGSGTVLRNFEHIVVQANSCRSECNVAAQCSGHGTCSEGQGLGKVTCQCASGFTGEVCDQLDMTLATSNGAAPSLTGTESASVRIGAFLDWLSGATVGDLGSAAQQIYAVHGDVALGNELVARFNAARNVDASRAIMILSVLGEMRTKAGHTLFKRVLAEAVPAPTGERSPVRDTLLAYQIKAVHGLGYLFTASGDQELLHLAGSHPERAIRAQAIRTYVFNQGDGARETARAAAKPGEEWYADRFENRDLNSGKTFDERLQEFAAKHPELVQN